jgi:spore germination protein YaaH
VHPKWWILNSDGITARKTRNNNNPTVIAAARANGVRLIPLIAAEGAADIRSMMNDAQKRAAHVQWLVQTAKDGGYDGWDIDYEHLWRAEDRAPFVAFMTELSTAMHAAGLELSMAIGGMAYDTGRHAYDYVALSAALDVLHIMGYDYHYTGSHQGPLAPLGWIDAVLAFAAKTGHIDRFVLGMANYAIAPNFFTNTRDALTRCTSAVSGETNHMESCEFDHYAAGRAPHCSSANGELWFEDLASMEEKMTLVQKHGARGVTYWTLGEELDGFFALVRRYFP